MGAILHTDEFTQVLVSAVRRGTSVGVGLVFRGRDDTTVRRVGYLVQDLSTEQATYDAILSALTDAQQQRVRGLTIYVDSAPVLDQLTRRVRVPYELMPAFVQVRCAANGLRRVRFEPSSDVQGFSARRLARAALVGKETIDVRYETPLLPLSFGDDLAPRPRSAA